MYVILDGKELREKKLRILKEKLENLETKPGLAVISVGNDESSKIYIRQKENLALSLGYNFQHISLEENVTIPDLISEISKLNNSDNIDGIIVQMPLPIHLDSSIIQNSILPEKDVDGLGFINMGSLIHNKNTLVPCTPKGIIDLLDFYDIELEGKNVVIIGRSILVGKPLALMMLNRNATVTVCHSKTKNIANFTKNADIIIVAVGSMGFLTKDMIKKDSIIIDVGINRDNGKLYGDADFENLLSIASYITPVPGGVGPMTVYELMEQVYTSHILRINNK